MSTSRKVARSAIIIMLFTLVSKFLGFIREILTASKFGSGMETDAYFVALSATYILMNLIGVGLNTTMVPILSEIETKVGKKRKDYYTNNLLNSVAIIAIFLMVLGWFIAPGIIRIMAHGFKDKQLELAVHLTRIGLPIMLFSGTCYVLTGYLHSSESFMIPAAVGFPFNFVLIFYLLFLSSKYGIEGLMVATVLAELSMLVIQIPAIKKFAFKYKFNTDFKDKYLKKVLLSTLPVVIGTAISEFNGIIDKTMASTLEEGSISALNYAYKINSLILGVFITAITTVVFPILSRESNKDNIEEVKSILNKGLNIILLITIPATTGLVVLSKPIVRIFFERGAFSFTDTMMTSTALIFYAIGLIGSGTSLMLSKVYYSLQDTKTPMINGTIAVTINILLNIILIRPLKHGGLALATSISEIITALLLYKELNKKIKNIDYKSNLKCLMKSLLAAVIMGVIVYGLYSILRDVFIGSKILELEALAIVTGVGLLVYGMLCYVFKVKLL